MDWRPYTAGQWLYTDDNGWLWDSDFDWGWACFHYGRWGWDNELGWYWVPGYSWSPAWVAWRRGGDFIGWVALPPEVRWQAGVGLEYGGFDLDDVPSRWVFVQARFFDEPRIRDHAILVSRNLTILPETHNVTRFDLVDGRIVDFGISIGWLEGTIHRPVPHFHVRHVDTVGEMHLPREHDGEISVFSPRVHEGREGFIPPRPGEIERRQEIERDQLRERHYAEIDRQEERHRQERAAPDADRERLQRQQQAEREALNAEHERQMRQLNNRQEHEREGFQRPFGNSTRGKMRQRSKRSRER